MRLTTASSSTTWNRGAGYLTVMKPIPATSSTTPISTMRVIFSSPRKNNAVKAMANREVVLMSGATTEICPPLSAINVHNWPISAKTAAPP